MDGHELPEINERRLGRINSVDYNENGMFGGLNFKNWFAMSQCLYKYIVPIRVEWQQYYQRFEIIALSQFFDPIEPGQEIPEYMAFFKHDDQSTKLVKIDRISVIKQTESFEEHF